MITGMHAIVYSEDADQTRAFFADVLGLPHVDAGDGWLIFGLPPAEIAAHPTAEPNGADAGRHQLYLMCDDIEATVAELSAKGVQFTSGISDEGWGLLTSLRLPGGGDLALYEPRHPMAAGMDAAASGG
jgi:catechol 2,3-dioxygenase-like lactoylglutathione lyase family enzyme